MLYCSHWVLNTTIHNANANSNCTHALKYKMHAVQLICQLELLFAAYYTDNVLRALVQTLIQLAVNA
jgi:hypothetical protein